MKSLKIIILTLCISFVVMVNIASASHIHFENFDLTTVSFNATQANNSYTWSFDLGNDAMALWSIPEDEAMNRSFDYVDKQNNFSIQEDSAHVYIGDGSINPDDEIHYAYLTMKFIGVNDGRGDSDEEKMDLFLDLILQPNYSNYAISQGGTGAIDVISSVEDDHYLNVTIKALEGDFAVDWIDLSGCFERSEEAPVTGTVPEPASLLLFGSGLVGAFIKRRKA